MIGSAYYTYSFEFKDCADDKVLCTATYQVPARPKVHKVSFLFPSRMSRQRMKRAAQSYAESYNMLSQEQLDFLNNHKIKS